MIARQIFPPRTETETERLLHLGMQILERDTACCGAAQSPLRVIYSSDLKFFADEGLSVAEIHAKLILLMKFRRASADGAH